MESRLTLLLPTLNERENIVPQIREVLGELPNIGEIIVVDDDSKDGTRDAVAEAFPEGVATGRIRIVHRTKELGLTNSLREGVQAARNPLVGWMDCDLSMPPATIRTLLQKIQDGADIAIGSRFAEGGGQKNILSVGEDSRAEIFLSTAMNKVLRWATKVPVTDFTSGFIVAKKELLDKFQWRGSHGEYFIYLMSDAHASGKKIIEVAYTCGTRRYGHSKTFGTWQATYRNSLRYSSTVLNVLRAKTVRI